MNHLIKKFKIAGAGGGKPKPKPATLTPPKLGVHQLASSFSYGEVLDLISDGPIDGLVNQNNSRVNGLAALQGIYLDNVPIAVTDDENVLLESEGRIVAYETSNIASYIKQLGEAALERPIDSDVYSSAYGSVKTYRNHNHNPMSDGSLLREGDGLEFFTVPNWNDIELTLAGNHYIPSNEFKYSSAGLARIQYTHASEFKLDDGSNHYPSDYCVGNPWNTIDNLLVQNRGWRDLRRDDGTNAERDYMKALFAQKPPNISRTDYVYNQIIEILGMQEISNDSRVLEDSRFVINGATTQIGNWSYFYVDAELINFDNADENTFIDEDGNTIIDIVLDLKTLNAKTTKILNYTYPELTNDGRWVSKKMRGFVLFFVETIHSKWRGDAEDSGIIDPDVPYVYRNTFFSDSSHLQTLADAQNFILKRRILTSQKYNYTNILAEVKKGKETQKPFKYFNNVYIDKVYESRLFGPFRVSGQIQKLSANSNILSSNYNLNSGEKKGLPSNEGSNDNRGESSFSNWDKNSISYDEDAISTTHVIENPNTESVIVSLGIDALSDTAQTDIKASEKVAAGSNYPGVVNVRIEIGKISEKGVREVHYEKRYQIVALVQSPTIIDIGNPDSKDFESTSYKFIKNLDADSVDSGVFEPLKLPSAFDVSGQEETPVKRFVKVTKLSTESNSILVKKQINVQKVTEIIPVNCSYPFSSIIGTKFDARTFTNVPTRTFDARLKLIQIPSNYFPIKDNILETDKRYYTSVVDYENATAKDKSIYLGDWDGSFKEGWTDNPAWILYDLLTNNRYGLGKYIDEDDINKWDLYKIGRFCDSVDEDGNFVGAPDGRGGLEPRYSCNIIFTEGTKVFDSINQIANLFRGSVFYNNNEINFVDDRLKDPTALFSNSNVKDGIFSYANYRRDEQFNAIEVIYIDRFDNFKSKVEYVEDEEDIKQRGMFKKQVNAYGVTSKAMANRIAHHLIYQTIKENQSVNFIGGNEVLLCKPGDLIMVEDELKSLKSNFGRVLDVDTSAKTVRINEPFITGEYTSGITLYSPTGHSLAEDVDLFGSIVRERLTRFSITGNAVGGDLDDFTGIYRFSGYTNGFDDGLDQGFFEQYALYTGERTPQNIIYYSTLATGWVFATGFAFTNNNEYDKFIGATGSKVISSLSTGLYTAYDSGDSGDDYRPYTNPPRSLSGSFDNSYSDLTDTTRGALESEISLVRTPQIITLSITGAVNQDYGSLLYVDSGDINANLLSFVSDGSAYRIQRQNADDQIYKIIEIREEQPNEYSVVATKYDSGKFDLIENSVSVEFQSDTFGYNSRDVQIGESNYITLDNPVISSVVTGSGSSSEYYISGDWGAVSNATGYNVVLREPNLNENSIFTSETGFSFDISDQMIGSHTFSVKALGDNSKNAGKRYFDSSYTSSGVSFIPTDYSEYSLDTSIISYARIN